MNAFIKLTPNMCPFCLKKTLAVVEREETIYTLDDYGLKNYCDTEDYDVKIQCQNCGEEFDAETKGNRWCLKHERPLKGISQLSNFNPFDRRG